MGFSYPAMQDFIQRELPNLDFKSIEKRFIQRTEELIPTELKAIKNASELLEYLADFPICVASNGEQPVVLFSLETTGLLKFFGKDHIFTHEMVAHGKPEPDLFLLAANKMGYLPEKCLVIEDSIIGTTAAKRAGMDVISIISRRCGDTNKARRDLEGLKPLAIIEDLLDVKKYLS
jgi:HAD superfamily hydrolase (TIGR01509 family)